MTRLSAYFFGGFHLYIGERPLGNFATRKSKLIYFKVPALNFRQTKKSR